MTHCADAEDAEEGERKNDFLCERSAWNGISSGNSWVLTGAMPLACSNILRIAEATITGEQVVGERVGFGWRQLAMCLLFDELARALVVNAVAILICLTEMIVVAWMQ